MMTEHLTERLKPRLDGRRMREVSLSDGRKLFISPVRRQRAWVASYSDGAFFGRFPDLPTALGAASRHPLAVAEAANSCVAR